MGLIGVVLLMGPGQEKRHHDDRFHADAERTNGHTSQQTIYEACLLRFRPM
jgi:hypothetical protein